MVYIKTYMFDLFSKQYLVLLTMAHRNNSRRLPPLSLGCGFSGAVVTVGSGVRPDIMHSST